MHPHRCAIRHRLLFASLLLGLAAVGFAAASGSEDYVVQVQVAVQAAPPRVALSWNVPNANAMGTGYTVKRRLWSDTTDWNTVASGLPASATGWADSNVSVATAYEYQVTRVGGGTSYNPDVYGYVAAMINRPLVDSRGTVVLLVDGSQAAALSSELTTLQADLAGDGWKIIRHDVARSATLFATPTGYDAESDGAAIKAIKAQIVADTVADPAVNHVLIIGHVPIPRSGDTGHDGHSELHGACVADTYYGDLAGTWTDTGTTGPDVVNGEVTFKGTNNSNYKGDGRFDQNTIPGSGIQLAVGRVDLYAMPAFAPLTETDLLRRYLAKDHAWRSGQWQVQNKCYLSDRLGNIGDGWGVPAINGWRLTSVVGTGNIQVQPAAQGSWFPTVTATAFLFGSGSGAGYFNGCDGIYWESADRSGLGPSGPGSGTAMFALNQSLVVFASMWGSGYPQWDKSDDFLRAPLANDGYGLVNMLGGLPSFVLHRMAVGESVGACMRLTQESTGARYVGVKELVHPVRSIYASVVGDPTLRAHPIVPPGVPTATVSGGNTVALSWTASPTAGVVGYHIYRATSANGPFVRLSGSTANAGNPAGSPVTGTTWTDTGVPTGGYTYLVKAVKQETTAGGTYQNTSLGSTVSVTTSGNRLAITAQPRHAVALPGQAATFSVTASGVPTPTYQWRRNGVDIPGATSASYTAPAAGSIVDDGTQYRVVVSNSVRSIASDAAILTVTGFKTQPWDTTVSVGGAATFTVAATGRPAPSYQWKRNGVDIPGATLSAYVIPATVAGDNGAVFTVVATNAATSITSNPARLVVNAPSATLTFTVQPQQVTVNPGQTATFTAAATGTSAPTYQWQRNGVNIPGATAASYTTPAVAVGDNGAQYRVVATNQVGSSTSNAAALGVRSSTPIFQADFNGLGTGTGGANDVVSVGGTGLVSNLNAMYVHRISKATPFSAGSGSYLNCSYDGTVQTFRSEYHAVATFTPATAANAFASFYGGTVARGGKSYVALQGGYDLFVRLNAGDPTSPGRSSNWFVAFAIDNRVGTNGLALYFSGLGSGNLRLQLSGGQAGAILNYTKVFGAAGSGSMASGQDAYMDSPSDLLTTSGTTYHTAFTLSTDANGLITAKVFLATGTGAIDTSATTALQYKATFNLDASVVGSAPLSAGAWTHGAWLGASGAPTNFDLDALRLFNADPGSFPSLGGLSIVTQPVGVTVSAGQTATFSVVAAGTPAPTYQWLKNGTAIPGATNASYTTPATVLSDNGAVFRVTVSNSTGTITSEPATLTVNAVAGPEAPYGGTAWAIPGRIEAENYDTGGDGVGYHDVEAANQGTLYRNDGVDITSTTDAGDGYAVGWVATGEWMRYTVNVATAGIYSVSFRIASVVTIGDAAGRLHLENGQGQSLTGQVVVPGTGSWTTWATVTATVALPAGQQVLRLVEDSGGYNINWMDFSQGSALVGSDIGSVASAGSSSFANGVWTVTGSGADIWNTADSFQFAHRQASGDLRITARVLSITNTDGWAKAGVMIRSSTAANSTNAFAAETALNGIAYQRRLTVGGVSLYTAGPLASAPYWVRLERIGDTITALTSGDGVSWQVIRQETVVLGSTVLIGLAVTSHHNGTPCVATFSDVTFIILPATNG